MRARRLMLPCLACGDGLRSTGTGRPETRSSIFTSSASARITSVVSRGSMLAYSILPISVRCSRVASESRSCEKPGSFCSLRRRTLRANPSRNFPSSALYDSIPLIGSYSFGWQLVSRPSSSCPLSSCQLVCSISSLDTNVCSHIFAPRANPSSESSMTEIWL